MKNKIKNIIISSALLSTSAFASVDVMMPQDDLRAYATRTAALMPSDILGQGGQEMFILAIMKEYQRIAEEKQKEKEAIALEHIKAQSNIFSTEEVELNIAIENSLKEANKVEKNPLLEALNTAKSSLKPVAEEEQNLFAKTINKEEFNSEETSFGSKVVTKDWGDKFSAVKSLFKQASDNRQELKEMREKHIERFEELQKEENPDYKTLTKAITADTIEYLNKRVNRLINKLGPTPTAFSLFSLGSMPRQESGFYTDLEIGILLDKNTPAAQKYFQKLIQLLSDELYLLGEHPDAGGKGLRIDEADNAPSHMRWAFRHASPESARDILMDSLAKREMGKKFAVPYEGSRIFLVTPERFAQYSDPDFDAKEKKKNDFFARKKHSAFERRLIQKEFKKALKNPAYANLSKKEIHQDVSRYVKDSVRPYSSRERNQVKNTRDLVRNIMHVYGDDRIFDRYMESREKNLSKKTKSVSSLAQNERQSLVIRKLTDDIIRFVGDDKSPISTGVLGDTIDLKRQFYRMPEQILTNLGFYFKLGVQNCQDIAEQLIVRGFFSEQVGQQFKYWMNYATSLRLKEQANVRKQGFAIPTTTDEHEDQLKDLEKEFAALERQHTLAKQIASEEAVNELEEKKNSVIKDMKRLKKQAPLQSKSVISVEEREKIEGFLPKCKALFGKTIDFLKGNWKAFQ